MLSDLHISRTVQAIFLFLAFSDLEPVYQAPSILSVKACIAFAILSRKQTRQHFYEPHTWYIGDTKTDGGSEEPEFEEPSRMHGSEEGIHMGCALGEIVCKLDLQVQEYIHLD